MTPLAELVPLASRTIARLRGRQAHVARHAIFTRSTPLLPQFRAKADECLAELIAPLSICTDTPEAVIRRRLDEVAVARSEQLGRDTVVLRELEIQCELHLLHVHIHPI